jgi:hypothetical protein
MKTVSKLPLSLATIRLLALVFLTGSCNLINEPKCPDPPYFPFTTIDKQWQNFTEAGEWVFENQRKQRRTYRVSKVYHGEKSPWYVGVFTERIGYYEDYWGMTWERTDSVSPAGYCSLRRIPVQKDPTQSVLAGEVYWTDYIGQANDTEGINVSYLHFGTDLSAISFSTLVVRGIKYQRVTHFQTSELAVSRLIGYRAPQRTTQLDYDEAIGVVRFVTLNGDVWERLP